MFRKSGRDARLGVDHAMMDGRESGANENENEFAAFFRNLGVRNIFCSVKRRTSVSHKLNHRCDSDNGNQG